MDERLKEFVGQIARNLSNNSGRQVSSLSLIAQMLKSNGFSYCPLNSNTDIAKILSDAKNLFEAEGDLETANSIAKILGQGDQADNAKNAAPKEAANDVNLERLKQRRRCHIVNSLSSERYFVGGSSDVEYGEGHSGWNR